MNLLVAAVMLASPVVVAADLTAPAVIELARGGITSECMVKIVKLTGVKLQFSDEQKKALRELAYSDESVKELTAEKPGKDNRFRKDITARVTSGDVKKNIGESKMSVLELLQVIKSSTGKVTYDATTKELTTTDTDARVTLMQQVLMEMKIAFIETRRISDPIPEGDFGDPYDW